MTEWLPQKLSSRDFIISPCMAETSCSGSPTDAGCSWVEGGRTYIGKVVMSIYRPVLLQGTTFLWPADKRAATDKCKYVTIKKKKREKRDKYLRSKVNIVRRVPVGPRGLLKMEAAFGKLGAFFLCFLGTRAATFPRYTHRLRCTWFRCYHEIRFGIIAVLNTLNCYSS